MLLEKKVKISEVSEFSILPYTQNRNLGNLGNFSFISNFDSCCKLRCKNNKKLTKTKTEMSGYAFRRKSENFRGFRVFDFALYPKSETRKSRKLLFYFKF